ncbi:MAG: MurR/RpiR family transcriptional regulator [Clostridia bacterium]|nr:MurR/RpiR family transcriptional regulator [Clostridia bacterium]
MNTTLTGLIEAHAPQFSKGQRRIAAFITEHYDEAAFMTAARLGDEVGVSESTVVRFATELGFAGYPQLQKALQELIRSKLTIVQRLDVTRARMANSDVLQQVATGDIGNIRRTLENLDKAVFEEAVERIVSARQVYVFGAGSCKHLAGFLTHYLQLLLGGRARRIAVASQSEIFEEMLDLSPEDVVIGISFPRYSKKAVQTLHYAHLKGAGVIALTDSALSPIAPHAQVLLTAHSDMASVVDSLVAPLSVINALIVAVSLNTMDRVRPKLEELEQLWNSYGMYQSAEETENGDL